jgi:hypothetical protein
MADGYVRESQVIDLARKIACGELTEDEALELLARLAVERR